MRPLPITLRTAQLTPISRRRGPKRYDWSSEEKSWFYARDGTRMLDLLETELSEKLRTSKSFKA